jgi:hypothetical protein
MSEDYNFSWLLLQPKSLRISGAPFACLLVSGGTPTGNYSIVKRRAHRIGPCVGTRIGIPEENARKGRDRFVDLKGHNSIRTCVPDRVWRPVVKLSIGAGEGDLHSATVEGKVCA